jgi:O-antigen/teichoic acid export membrane protein
MKQTSLKKNFLMNALLTMSTFIFPLITFPYVSRILGPAGTGKVNFATSLITYFSMFAQLGIPTYGIRACAQVRDDREELTRTTHELLLITIVMSIISYIALIIALIFIPRLQADRDMYIIVSFTIILTSIGMEWLYKGLEQYTYITFRSILFKFVALIAMFLLINSKDDYVIYAGISIFAASASSVLNFINIHK